MKEWTQKEIDILTQLVSQGTQSTKQIAKTLNRSFYGCKGKIYKLGLRNKYVHRIYSTNEKFWDIPNELNCYWAGFSAADACIEQRENNHISYRLKLAAIDKEHLEKFKNDSGSNSKMIKFDNGSAYGLTINCDYWKESLAKNFFIVPNKTNRIMSPNITDKNLLFCWLIGYIDGDGYLCFSKHIVKNKMYKSLGMGFVSSSKLLIEWIKMFIEENFPARLKGKNPKIHHKEGQNFWKYDISGLKVAVIIDYLSKFNVPKLKRKWENPELWNIISVYKEKYPNLFKI